MLYRVFLPLSKEGNCHDISYIWMDVCGIDWRPHLRSDLNQTWYDGWLKDGDGDRKWALQSGNHSCHGWVVSG